jgi:hypothetical protein
MLVVDPCGWVDAYWRWQDQTQCASLYLYT